jgi:hypothetical protein
LLGVSYEIAENARKKRKQKNIKNGSGEGVVVVERPGYVTLVKSTFVQLY